MVAAGLPKLKGELVLDVSAGFEKSDGAGCEDVAEDEGAVEDAGPRLPNRVEVEVDLGCSVEVVLPMLPNRFGVLVVFADSEGVGAEVVGPEVLGKKLEEGVLELPEGLLKSPLPPGALGDAGVPPKRLLVGAEVAADASLVF